MDDINIDHSVEINSEKENEACKLVSSSSSTKAKIKHKTENKMLEMEINSVEPSQTNDKYQKSKNRRKKSGKNEKFYLDSKASTESPKYHQKIENASKHDINYKDLLVKLNSEDNMRKTGKQNKTSPPNKFPEFKDIGGMPSPNFSKHRSSKPDKDFKTGSKSPETKGATSKKFSKQVGSRKKNVIYEPYIPLFQVQQGLKRGEFIEGALRINQRSYEDAYVCSPDGKMDIYIGGMKDRNRALNGDIVVVQINPKQEWKVLCDAIKDYQEKCENVVETVCEPVPPAVPCQIHTPDKFLKSHPVSSNSWSSSHAERAPDTVEILGVDKLAKQFETISVKQKELNRDKAKHKNKCKKYEKQSSSQKSTTSHSRESSEDCLDKTLPTLAKYSRTDEIQNSNKVMSLENENGHLDPLMDKTCDRSYQPDCDMNNIGTFYIDDTSNKAANDSWENKETSYNITVSPHELLNFDEDSLFQHLNFYKTENKEDDSNSSIEGIAVAPDDLSGDDFTDSASIGSSCSEHLNQVYEDAAFLATQQDAENNNVNSFPPSTNVYNFNFTEYSSVVTNNSIKTCKNPLEIDCKMQQNKVVPQLSAYDISSNAIVCTTLNETSFIKDNYNSSDEEILTDFATMTKCPALISLSSDQCGLQEVSKKSKHRKRKKNNQKNIVQENNIVEKKHFLCTEEALTVDEVMKHPEWTKFVQKTGKVVHILERKHSRLAAGYLKLCNDKNKKWALFSPNDSRIPRIMVPMSECPQNFYYRSSDYANVLFVTEIVQWDETSKFATGRLIKSLGTSGNVDVETEAILLENGVDFSDFSVEILNCLPETEPWNIPEKEIKNRKDFRKQCIFTVDPASARDMDDAVSCSLLDNGNFEVGVHIADVTYFVPEGTDLDSVAKKRSTSVYLVQKVIPMLPRRLCDDLCSLNPGKDRLTFSVVWEMSPDGKIHKQWIGRSIINSCIKLSYEHAQDMIENPSRIWNSSEHPPLYGGFSIYDVIQRINSLHCLAVKLRERRFQDGALRLDQPKLQFTLNPESGLPSGFNVFVQKDSNRLIEEFMLLANMSVAAKIYEEFPVLALLRRHPPPHETQMENIISVCESLGIILDASSSGALQSSIAHYTGNDNLSKARTQLLMNLFSKPMNCALYFCAGVLKEVSLFHHYALNVPLYTHFTSPIRRYPDIIVHRLLGAALHLNPIPRMVPEEIEKCALHCNDKKYNAKRVSELSSELFLAAFVQIMGSVPAKGMVITVMDHSFDCLILDMGIVKRVYCDKLPIVKKEYKKVHGVPMLHLTWKTLSEMTLVQTIIMFALVDVVLTVGNDSLQIKVTLKSPSEL